MASSVVTSSPDVAPVAAPPAGAKPVAPRAPWWLQPALIVVVLSGFGLYATWAAFQGHAYEVGPYLSPFYSPAIWTTGPISSAIWILWIPLLFRASCYYYRKSYYRSFFWDPPACAVRELRRGGYRGETAFPWVFSNLHRFFLYLSIVVLAFLWYDAIVAFIWQGRFYLGLGSLILLVNVVLLSLYTVSCHSLRHLLGGNVDCYSCAAAGQARYGLWSRLSQLNRRHGLYAWLSLFSVLFADVYVRFLAAGVEHLPVVH
ncbi:MAG TPA: succinate dehydrogenase [Chloroflexota bacterium]|nr:succinate dehydrogenase [Chloroflexota bacterium]